jgi:aldose 1-epimerase
MYSSSQISVGGIDVVQLADASREMRVSIAPSIGNIAYEFSVHEKNYLWFPYAGPAELRANPKLCGIPFLAPWANRIDGVEYWVNDRRYVLNRGFGNLRWDPNQKPIHGLLLFSPLWSVVSADADAESASAVCRLQFWKHPELMTHFPFAHEIIMMYRLAGGTLQIQVSIENVCDQPLPVAVGHHPYFQLHTAHRDEWLVHIAARDHLTLDQFLIPTGAHRSLEFADPHPLRAGPLDDGFANLIREPDGTAKFQVMSARERLTVTYGPNYQVAVIYAPQGRDYICFEPMAAITNTFNLAHSGVYKELQSIPPGGTWRESFWVTPESTD